MTASGFRRIALTMQGAIEAAHMGHPDFRAAGRIFATLHPDNLHGMVKLTPEQQAQIVAEHSGAFAPENGAWGRQGCTRVGLAAVDAETLGEAMTLAWQNAQRAPARRSTKRAPPRASTKAAPRRSR